MPSRAAKVLPCQVCLERQIPGCALHGTLGVFCMVHLKCSVRMPARFSVGESPWLSIHLHISAFPGLSDSFLRVSRRQGNLTAPSSPCRWKASVRKGHICIETELTKGWAGCGRAVLSPPVMQLCSTALDQPAARAPYVRR